MVRGVPWSALLSGRDAPVATLGCPALFPRGPCAGPARGAFL